MSQCTEETELQRMLREFKDETPLLPPGRYVTIGDSTQEAMGRAIAMAQAGVVLGIMFGPVGSEVAKSRSIAEVHSRIIKEIVGADEP